MKTAAKKTAAKKKKAPAVRSVTKTRQKKLVDKAILSIESKIDADEVKGSVGDLLRLLEFKKEIEGQDAADITVTWVGEKPRGK
jgi:hypothetical protein